MTSKASLYQTRHDDRRGDGVGAELPDQLGREQLSLSVGLESTNGAHLATATLQRLRERRRSRQIDRRPSSRVDRGGLRRGSLRFLDVSLERRYQRQGARRAGPVSASPPALRRSCGSWPPSSSDGTPIPPDLAIPVCFAMALLNWAAFLLSGRADTLDRQHSIVSFLTSVNGLVILWLASTGGVLPGYGISAIMLLFAFGFVARTGFIFAAWRSAVIVAGFAVAAILYPGRAASWWTRSSLGPP